MKYEIEKNEMKIREYFERKYNVDFSNIKINVVRVPRTEGRVVGVRGEYYIFLGGKWEGAVLGTVCMGTGLLLASQGNLESLLGYALIYAGLLGCFLALLEDTTLAHEYAHIAWHERIYRFKELFGSQTLEYKVDKNLMEAFAEFEEEKAPVPRTSKIGNRVLKILLPFFSYRRYKKLFKQLDEINPEKPRLKNLDQIITRVDKSGLSERDKQLMKELFQEEYNLLEKSGMLDWIKNSPAILPEKSKTLEKLAKLV